MGLIEYAFLGKQDVVEKFQLYTSEDVISIHGDQYFIPVLSLNKKGELKDFWTGGDLSPRGRLHVTLELLKRCEPNLRWELALAHVQSGVDGDILSMISAISGKKESDYVDSLEGKTYAEKRQVLEQVVRTQTAFNACPLWRIQEAINLVESLSSMEGPFCTLSADTDNVISSYTLDYVSLNSDQATLFIVEIHK